MASRSLFRLASPNRLPMNLYRIAVPYRQKLTLQRHDFSSTVSRSAIPKQKLDMSNPLYRDLIKSIKNPFVGDLIHKLVQGDATLNQSLSEDLNGAGNSLYFRIPELPPRMKGDDQDPDGIPLPPNTFRVSSVEELRTILERILAHRAALEKESSATWDDHLNSDNSAVAADIAKENVPLEETKAPSHPPPPPPKPDTSEMPVWSPSESFDTFKTRFHQYLKTGKQLVEERVQGGTISSALEPLEQQVRQLRESLQVGKAAATYNNLLQKRLKDKIRELGELRRNYGKEQSIEERVEKEAQEREASQQSAKEQIAMHKDPPNSFDKEYSATASTSSESDKHRRYQLGPDEVPVKVFPGSTRTVLEKDPDCDGVVAAYIAQARDTEVPVDAKTTGKSPQTPVDPVEPAIERITLMDILNGTASSSSQKGGEGIDELSHNAQAIGARSRSPETSIKDPDTPSTTSDSWVSTSMEPLIAKLTYQLDELKKFSAQLESHSLPGASTTEAADFQKFTDHMDEALATQYSDLRDYFEERVLSETRDVAARVGSLEQMMQKILENQEAAAAQSKDGVCIYSTEGCEPGEEPKVPVTVNLDEVDKAGIQKVVDTAVNTAIERVLAGFEKNREENNEDLVEAIVDGLEEFKTYDLVERVVREVLDSRALSKHLDSQVKIHVAKILEELSKDENGYLQRSMEAAAKDGMKDIEEIIKARLGDVQLKLFGMEKVLRDLRRKQKNDEGWLW